MQPFWLSTVVAIGLASAAPAQEAQPRTVIEAQIAAFLADDFEAAFAFASPAIRSIFGTHERFGAMVQQGYPMVHRPAELRFLDRSERGAVIIQRVLITDQGGAVHVLEYELLPAEESFLINGVRILQGQGAGV